ncbi:MAG: phosphodiester glycosidase family protein [Chloroflexaceae bacterium]|nr:phosphodiester glycosidase family protein [Chloroflexaceae bacterium]
MSEGRSLGRWLLWPIRMLMFWSLAGCSVTVHPLPAFPDAPPVLPPPASEPAYSPLPAPPTPVPPPPADTGWTGAGPGVEVRHLSTSMATYAPRLQVHMVRLDPALVRFHVAYAPDQPYVLSALCEPPGVLAAINGGFFEENYRATALVISEGTVLGTSYEGQGGMFAVDEAGQVSLRSLVEQPYDPNEPLVEALQGWPMLVKPGGILASPHLNNTNRARRSVVATNRAGRVLLLAFSSSSLTLHELAGWLLASDLEIDAALNLDGGSSTGLCLNSGGQRERVEPFGVLPMALLVLRTSDSSNE